ncbi:hypothetical protein EXIGLDRAFT_693188 [Exidia glandulosa HHB12029]|uniref:Pentacotripeptide-repeat region of PRORP domain-containing protein n=1 Tax=Exidia glandulosa HHB12029 TaxID=1314781 RepID=A0A165HGV1_EXIGL|nr:hypothetical protein EXIGLDRAFT_693188 [Exidia glandulosa HHB12029]
MLNRNGVADLGWALLSESPQYSRMTARLLLLIYKPGVRPRQNIVEGVAHRLAVAGRWSQIPGTVELGERVAGRTTKLLLTWKTRACMLNSDLPRARDYLNAMTRGGLPPDDITHVAIVAAYHAVGKKDDVEAHSKRFADTILLPLLNTFVAHPRPHAQDEQRAGSEDGQHIPALPLQPWYPPAPAHPHMHHLRYLPTALPPSIGHINSILASLMRRRRSAYQKCGLAELQRPDEKTNLVSTEGLPHLALEEPPLREFDAVPYDPSAGLANPQHRPLVELLALILNHNVRSNTSTFALRLWRDAVTRLDMDGARTTFKEMTERGIRSNSRHFTILMDAWAT